MTGIIFMDLKRFSSRSSSRQGVVGQRDTRGVDRQDAVVLPRTFSRVVREPFQSTTQHERGQYGHPRGKFKA